MMSTVRKVGVVVATVGLTLMLAGCTGSATFGFSGIDLGGIPVQADRPAVFSAPLVASAATPLTLLGVKLISIPGFPIPRLIHVSLLGRSLSYPTGTTGWPPTAPGAKKTYPLRRFAGAKVDPVAPRGGGLPPTVLYAVAGAELNHVYAVAGLEITFRVGTTRFTKPVYEGGMACVVKFRSSASRREQHWCESRFALIIKVFNEMPALKERENS
jgi:hypothetical protein